MTNDTDSSKWKEEKPTSKNDDGQQKAGFMSIETKHKSSKLPIYKVKITIHYSAKIS